MVYLLSKQLTQPVLGGQPYEKFGMNRGDGVEDKGSQLIF